MKHLIILDINSTLLYRKHENDTSDEFKLGKPNFIIGPRKCYFRPHVEKFLDYVFKCYDVGIWTSGIKSNMRPVIDKLMNGRKPKFILTREDCSDVKNGDDDFTSTKDVAKRIFAVYPEYSAKNTIIIEDSTEKYLADIRKLVITISKFRGDPADNKLLDMIKCLEVLFDASTPADDIVDVQLISLMNMHL